MRFVVRLIWRKSNNARKTIKNNCWIFEILRENLRNLSMRAASPKAIDTLMSKVSLNRKWSYYFSMKRCSKPYRFHCSSNERSTRARMVSQGRLTAAFKPTAWGKKYEKTSFGGRLVSRHGLDRWLGRCCLRGRCVASDQGADVQGRRRSVQEL